MTDSAYLCFLLCLMSSPCLVLLLHVLLIRMFRLANSSLSPLPVAALAMLGGYPVMGFSLWFCHFRFLNPGQITCPIVYALIVYTCLSFCYFILFTMTETARRIHILRRIFEKDAPAAMNDLAVEYSAADMLSVRIERMLALKQLKRSGDRYFIDNKLLYRAGTIVAAWAKLLGFSAKDRL